MAEAKITVSAQDLASAVLDAVNKKLRETGDASQASSQHVRGFGESIGGLVEGIPVVEGLVAAFTVDKILEFSKGVLESAGRIEDLSLATGLSTDAVQKLGYAGQEVGLDIDTMTRGVEQLSRRLASGDANAVSAIQSLGLSVDQLKAAGPEEFFYTLAETVGRIEDPTMKARAAWELFGKLGLQMLPLMNAHIRDLAKEAENAGAVISKDTVNAAHEFDVGVSHLMTTTKAYIAEGLVGLYGWLKKVAEAEGEAELAQAGLASGMGDNGPIIGHDIELLRDHTEAGKGVISNADMIANRLKALREDALTPLSATQQQQIAELHEWHVAEKEIAELVGTTELAVKRYIDTLTKSAEAQKQLAREQEEAWKESQRDIVESIKAIDSIHDATFKLAMEREKTRRDEATKTAEAIDHAVAQTFETAQTYQQKTVDLSATEADRLVQEWSEALNKLGPPIAGFEATWQRATDDIDAYFAAKLSGETMAAAVRAGADSGHGFTDAFSARLAEIPDLLAQAFTGGGGATGFAKAIASKIGGDIGKELAEGGAGASISDGLAKLFNVTSAKGSSQILNIVQGGLMGGVSSLLSFGIQKLLSIGGPSQEELQGRDVEGQFEQMMGGIAGIGKALTDAGLSADQANAHILALFAAEKQGGAAVQAQIDAINGVIKQHATDVSSGVQRILDAAKVVGSDFPAAMRPVVDQLAGLPGLTDDERNALLDLTKSGEPSLDTLTQTASKYGMTLDELGPKTQQLDISQRADQTIRDFQMLVDSGADYGDTVNHFSGQVSGLVVEAERYGGSLPRALQPIADALVNAGLLTDDTGHKITDLSHLKFDDTGDPLAKGMQTLTDAINHLSDLFANKLPADAKTAADKIGSALGSIQPPDIHIGYRFEAENSIPSFANEAYDLTRPTYAIVGDAVGQSESVLQASTVRDIVRASRNAGAAIGTSEITDGLKELSAQMARQAADLRRLFLNLPADIRNAMAGAW